MEETAKRKVDEDMAVQNLKDEEVKNKLHNRQIDEEGYEGGEDSDGGAGGSDDLSAQAAATSDDKEASG